MLFDPDFDWELFPRPEDRPRRGLLRAAVVAAIVVFWFVDRPFAVVAACVAVSFGDFREGFRLARAVPDPAGARVCLLFRLAWGTLTAALMGFVLMFAMIPWIPRHEKGEGLPLEAALAMLAWILGFLASAALTAAGMIAALRSGMRVWIGEGVNQARVLLLGMMISAFAIGVVFPAMIWFVEFADEGPPSGRDNLVPFLVMLGLIFVGPIAILIALDRIGRRVIAKHPGKFGPKVPSVGKWNA
ncbi:hypothetical protein [Paludisphaera sp.]|uniref:hypothetical protein n=1 Tax=Paludisphaera sp. TaxID=2017432 RepID=UPI00301C28E7